jgi:hypothetical protein
MCVSTNVCVCMANVCVHTHTHSPRLSRVAEHRLANLEAEAAKRSSQADLGL